MSKIPAKNLASGDCVKFPRLGWRKLLRIRRAGNHSISFICSDDKIRSFRPEQLIEAELRTDTVIFPREGEILRLDLESGRTSVVSPSLFGFSSEISESFKVLSGRVTTFPDIAALEELRRGARLFTERAIYTMPKTEEIKFVPQLKDITSFEWQGL